MASSFSTRRPPIDPEEVFRSADAMVQEGKQVTALAILDALGGGSLRTIYKHLTEWEKNRKEAPQVSSSSEVPEAVKSAFASVLSNTWKVAATEAAKEVTAAKEKAAAEVADAQAKFDGALEGIQKLEIQNEQDSALIDELKAQILQQQEALTKSGNDNAALKATAEQLQEQVKSHALELDRVHQEFQQQQKAHQEEQQKSHTEVSQLRAQISEMQNRAEKSDRERTETQVTLEHTNKQLSQMAERLQSTEQKQETANKERDSARQEAAELKGQAQALQAQNAELMSKLAGPKKPI